MSMGFSREGYWSGLPFPSPEYVAEVEYFLGFLFMPFEWTKKRLFSGSHHEMMAHFPHTSSFKEEKGILRFWYPKESFVLDFTRFLSSKFKSTGTTGETKRNVREAER